MANQRIILRLKPSLLETLAPWLMWLLAIIMPLAAGRFLVESAIEIDRKLWLASTRQMLMNEAQQYKNHLNPEMIFNRGADSGRLGFLFSMIHRHSVNELTPDELLQYPAAKEELKNHEIGGRLPWGRTNIKSHLGPLLEVLQKRIGAMPSAIYCLSEAEEEIFYETGKTFSLLCSPESMLETLKRAAKIWNDRRKLGSKADRFFRFYHALPELQKWLGLFYSPNNEIFGLRERFSSRANDTVYIIVLYFVDGAGNHTNLNLVYERLKIDWRMMLKTVFSEVKRGGIKHSFGYSAVTNLPQMIETDDEIEYIFELPSEFRKIFLAQNVVEAGENPVLRLSASKKSDHAGGIKLVNLEFAYKLSLMFSLLVPVVISLKRMTRTSSLKKLLAVSFFIGAAVPVSGLIWVTISFINSQKFFEAEKVLAQMGRQLKQVEKKMELQRCRNEIYYNLLAYRVGQIPIKERRNLNRILDRFDNHVTEAKATAYRPIVGYYMLNRDGFEHLEVKDNFLANLLQIKPFFSGVYNDMLLQMGSFADLKPAQLQEIRNKSQLAMGVTENLTDPQMFVEIPEFECSRVKSTMTARTEFFSAFWLDRQFDQPGSLFAVYSDNGDWIWQINQLIIRRIIPVEFSYSGYRIIMGFFRLDKLNLTTIDQLPVKGALSHEEFEFLTSLGRGLFANSGYHTINNIAETPANLILAKIIGEGNFFAVAYAEKKSGSENLRIIVSFLILIALISSIVLAAGTARVLLMSLPAFSEAITQVQRQNYDWQIEVKSGDEFEQLGQSFNLMGRKLLEREKMSQLVSENVMEAIADAQDGLLKPGGEKRHAAILFSDIRGFTSLSEKFAAEEIVEMLNAYFTEMAEVIGENGGIIDKLIGDAIQAVFYQKPELAPAEIRACRAALAMKQRLKKYNRLRRQLGKFEISNGIGIASGEVISGRVGSETGKLDATVLGKKLHLAESLEAKSKFAIESSILIDSQTAQVISVEGLNARLVPFQLELEPQPVFELVRLE